MHAKAGLGPFGRSVMERTGKKGWFAGVNAIGRKLVRYCFSVLVNDEPFVEGMFHGKKGLGIDEEIGGDGPEAFGLGAVGLLENHRLASAGLWDSAEEESTFGEERPWPLGNVYDGADGRTCTIIVNDPKAAPENGQFMLCPVVLQQNGRLREARQLAEVF